MNVDLSPAATRYLQQLPPTAQTVRAATTGGGALFSLLFAYSWPATLMRGYETIWDLSPRGRRDLWRPLVWLVVFFAVVAAAARLGQLGSGVGGLVATALLGLPFAVAWAWWGQHLLLFLHFYLSCNIESQYRSYGPIGVVFVLQSWLIALSVVMPGRPCSAGSSPAPPQRTPAPDRRGGTAGGRVRGPSWRSGLVWTGWSRSPGSSRIGALEDTLLRTRARHETGTTGAGGPGAARARRHGSPRLPQRCLRAPVPVASARGSPGRRSRWPCWTGAPGAAAPAGRRTRPSRATTSGSPSWRRSSGGTNAATPTAARPPERRSLPATPGVVREPHSPGVMQGNRRATHGGATCIRAGRTARARTPRQVPPSLPGGPHRHARS